MKTTSPKAHPTYLKLIQKWLSLGLLSTLGSPAFAATLTWTTGDGGNGLWSNTANWGGSTPAINDTLVFGTTTGTTTLTHDLPNNYSWTNTSASGTNFRATGITFNSDAPAYTINGSGNGSTSLTLDGTIAVNSASNITQTINSNLTATNGVTVTGAGNLVLGGSYGRLGTWTGPFVMNGTGLLTLNGSNMSMNGAFTMNSGTVLLAKSNAGGFAPGSVTINGGTIKLGAAEQLKSAGNLTLNGGTLDLNGFDSNVGGNGAGVAVVGPSTAGGITQLTGLGGRVTNNAAGTGTNWLVINQNAGQQVSYGGTITDGATAKVGLSVMANYNQTAFQALTGNNTYSGGTFIQHLYNGSGGRPEILSIGSVASIGSAGSRNLTFKGGNTSADVILQLTGTAITNSNQFNGITFTSGLGAGFDIADPNNTFTLGKNAGGTDIAFTGTGVFEKLGAGTLVVSSNLANTSGIYFGGGTLKIDAQSGGALATNVLTFSGGNLYLLGKSSGSTTQTFNSVILGSLNNYGTASGGASMITVDANGGGGATLTLGNMPTTTTASYSLNIKTLTGGTLTTTTNTTAGGTTAANGMVGTGRILFTDASNNVDFAGISVSGTNRTIQAAIYTPGLPVSGSNSTLTYSQQDNASVTTSESVYALKLTTNTTGQSLSITSGQTLTLTSGGLLFSGANDYSITGGTLASNTATNSDLIIHQYGAGNLTIGSVIANGNGASTLTKAGNGTLVLSGANTYTGQTYVTGGILSISSDSNLNGANGTFANLTSATNSASVTYTGSLPTGFGVGSTILGRTVNAINTGTSTITLSGNANTALSGGTASWVTATTLNLYSGGILQANGTFSLQESNAGGTAGTTTVNRGVTIGNSGGGFDVTTGNTLTITGSITATGMMTKSGAGTLTLSAANNLTGGITITDGTVQQNIDKALTNNNSNTATSNLIFGDGTAPKLQLNNHDAALTSLVGSNANAIVENGAAGTKTLTVSNGADNTYAGKLQNGSAGVLALAKSGGATLTLTGANTYTGPTTISNGTLSVGSIGNGGVAGNLGQATNVATNLVFDGGTLQYTGANATSNRAFSINALRTATIDTANSISFAGATGSATTGALTKTGNGTLTLTGANTYTGGTTINAGTLALSGSGSLSDLTAVVVNSPGSFDISGISSSEKIASLSGATGSTLKLGAKVLEFGDANDTSFTGAVESNTGGGVKKVGSGVFTLGASSYTGTGFSINISQGSLLTSANNLPSSTAFTLSGGSLNTGTFSNSVGSLSVTSGSIIDFAGGGTPVLTFASRGTWTGLLQVWNWSGSAWSSGTGGQLRFADGVDGSLVDVSKIQFYSGAGTGLISEGGAFIGTQLVPVPEPGTLVSSLLLLGVIGFQRRRKSGSEHDAA